MKGKMLPTYWWCAPLLAGFSFACSEPNSLSPLGSNDTSETSKPETDSGAGDTSGQSSNGRGGSHATTITADASAPEPDASGDGSADASASSEGNDSSDVLGDGGPPPPVTGRYDAGFIRDSGITDFETDCEGNRAFVTTGGAFVDPTPPRLALRLNQEIFGQPALTLVLLNEAYPPRMTTSYSVETDGLRAFPNLKPELVDARTSSSGFTYEQPQVEGWMWLEREGGTIELPLRNLHVTATTMADCTRVVFTLSAVVPAQDFDLIDTGIRIDAGPEARDEPAPDTSVRAIFEAELTHFDFGSLP